MVSNWAKRSGLAINPSKREMVLFIRKSPHSEVNFFNLFDKLKYEGLILDRKLSRRPRTEEGVRKVSVPYISVEKIWEKGEDSHKG